MTIAADTNEAKLTILLDVRHPLAYLALHPAIAFGRSHGLEVNWLPLAAPPLHPPSKPRDDDDRGIRHRRYRAEAIAREIETYAAAQDLVLRDYYRSNAPDAANIGWLWVRDRHPDQLERYLAELFRAYWAVEVDSSSVSQIAALIDSLALDAAAFRTFSEQEGPAAADALADELRERGLFQVPAFVVEEEVFYGRQHLPMIAWILGGRTGPGPI